MSEPDDKPRRRPPTIDLTATELEPERASGAGEAAAAATARRSPAARGFGPYAVGGLGGMVIILAILAAAWSAGLLAPRQAAESAPVPAAAATDNDAVDEISARLTKVEAALAAPRNDPALAARMASEEAETRSITDTLPTLNRRLDGLEGAVRDARSRADEASAAADTVRRTAQSSVQRGDLDALAGRVAALERTVKTTTEEVAKRMSSGADHATRSVVATEALRAAVERGDPYAPALAAVKALGANPDALASLAPFAAGGVPSAATLAHELSLLAPELRRTSGATPSDGGFLDRLQANAQKLVRVTPIDAPAGDDPNAVIARIEADAARVDINTALGEIAKLPEPARAQAAPWVERAQARNAAIAAGRRIAGDALAALAKPDTQ